MRFRNYIIVPAASYGLWKLAERLLIHEDALMSFEQRCRKYGLSTERHFVTTDDGYILQVFRLIAQDPHQNKQPKPPVLLMHGFNDSCMSFVSNQNNSPAIYLANKGFDVWVGNNRGNSYSRLHRTLVPDVDSKYWDFSFEEMGLYDTKAMIKHISDETSIQKVSYIGLSQGGTQMYYGLALNNEWFKEHLNLVVWLGSPVKRLPPSAKSNDEITAKFIISKVLEVLLYTPNTSKFGKKLNWMMMRLYPEYGNTYKQDILEGKPELNSVDSWQSTAITKPNGTSPRTEMHRIQITKSHKIARYDFGEQENIKRYGIQQPPLVDISTIRDVPIAMFYGKYDCLVSLTESRWIRDNLDPSVLKHYEEWESGHVTFLVGKQVDYLDKVQKLIREYSQ